MKRIRMVVIARVVTGVVLVALTSACQDGEVDTSAPSAAPATVRMTTARVG